LVKVSIFGQRGNKGTTKGDVKLIGSRAGGEAGLAGERTHEMMYMESPQEAKKVAAHSVLGSKRFVQTQVPLTHCPRPEHTTPDELQNARRASAIDFSLPSERK